MKRPIFLPFSREKRVNELTQIMRIFFIFGAYVASNKETLMKIFKLILKNLKWALDEGLYYLNIKMVCL